MYKKAFLISLLMGALWGLTIVYIAIEHNPQMAVYNSETGVYNIKYLVGLFTSWSVLVTFGLFVLFVLLGLFIWVWKFLKREK